MSAGHGQERCFAGAGAGAGDGDGRERQVGELYGPLAASLRRAIEGYADDELAMLTGFIRRLRSVVAGTAESVRLRRN